MTTRQELLYRYMQRRRTDLWGAQYATNDKEIALRFLEEAMELCQSVGLAEDAMERVLRYVFRSDHTVGSVEMELGQSALVLYYLADLHTIDLEDATNKALIGFLLRDDDIMRAKQRIKINNQVALELPKVTREVPIPERKVVEEKLVDKK